MSEEIDVQKSKKRASARPLWKDICAQFGRYRPLLGSYVIILNNVAWGTHASKTRKKTKEQPEQWIIALTNIAKLFGMDPRNAMRELNMLEYMGVITLGKNGEQNLVITSTNECKKNAEDAEKVFPKIKRTNSGRGHSSDSLPTRAVAIVQTNELGPWPKLNSGRGHSSNERTRAVAIVGEDPSLYEKNTREEEIKEEGREEEELSDPPQLNDVGNSTDAEEWLTWISEDYPNNVYNTSQLVPIVARARELIVNQKIPGGMLMKVMAWVSTYGSDYLKDKFFKEPKSIIEQDEYGNTFIEEAGNKYKSYLTAQKRKSKSRIR